MSRKAVFNPPGPSTCRRVRLRSSAVIALGCIASGLVGAMAAAESRVEIVVGENIGGVPGIPGTRFAYTSGLGIDATGGVGFLGSVHENLASDSFATLWAPNASDELTLIVREDFPLPGVPDSQLSTFVTGTGPIFDSFSRGQAMNGLGDVAFSAVMRGPTVVGSLTDTGVWGPDANGNLTLLARNGSGGVPGIPGAHFDQMSQPLLNNQREVAFFARLRAGIGGVDFSNQYGIWGPDFSGELNLIARTESGGVPGIPDASFAQFERLGLSDGHGVMLQATLAQGIGGVTSQNNQGIWRPGNDGNLQLIARSGSGNVPGIPGASFTQLQFPFIGASGDVAFRAELAIGPGGVAGTSNVGVWLIPRDGEGSLVARSGSGSVPGVPGADFHHFVGATSVSAHGLAFVAELVQGKAGVDSSNNLGIWGFDPNGVLTLVARKGSSIPGIPGSTLGIHEHIAPVLNGNGNIVYAAATSQPGEFQNALFISDGWESVLIARGGDSILGNTLSDIGVFLVDGEDGRRMMVNDAGQVVFQGDGVGVMRFTPGLHWRPMGDASNWDDRRNWTLSLRPGDVHSVVLESNADAVVAGPAVDTVVSQLQIGGGLASTTLVLEPNITLTAKSQIIVTNRGVLAGGGAIRGELVVDSGGTIAPGTFDPAVLSTVQTAAQDLSPELNLNTLHVNGALRLEEGGIYEWTLNDAIGTAGDAAGWGLVAVDGVLDLAPLADAAFVLKIRSPAHSLIGGSVAHFDPTLPYEWTIVSTTLGILDFTPSKFEIDSTMFGHDLAGGSLGVSHRDGSLYMTFTPVPEPATWLLAMVGAFGLTNAMTSRRRRSTFPA